MLIYGLIRAALGSSPVEIQVYRCHTIRKFLQDKCIGSFKDSAEQLLSDCALGNHYHLLLHCS